MVEAKDYYNKVVSHPTAESATLKSNNPYYYNYQFAILSENHISQAKCKECLLLITVERQAAAAGEEKSKFVIECTQEDRSLRQNSPVAGYLNKHSLALFEIHSPIEGALLISLNTQNQDCARVFVKKGEGEGRASESDHEYKSSGGSVLVLKSAKEHLDVTIEATENCYYSIDYTSAVDKQYSMIDRGLYTDVKLTKGEDKRIIYHHISNDSFRVLTLHQSGEVIIKVRPYATVKDFISDHSIKEKNAWSGRDFVRVDEGTKLFCFDCYYLIMLSAERQTRTSVMIPSMTS